MSQNIRENSEGGRARLPSLLDRSARDGRLLRALSLTALCLVVCVTVKGQTPQQIRQRRQAELRRQQAIRAQIQAAHAQNQPTGAQNQSAGTQNQTVRPQSPAGTPVRPNVIQKPGPVRRPLDKVALELLRKMIRPTTDYIGEMVTQVAAQGNLPLQQKILGDKQGRTLTTFTNGKLAGDVLLVGPGEVRNYHRSTGVMDVAQWPTEWDDHEKRMFAAIRSGFYTAQVVGSEQVAGRQASIVELIPVAGVGEPGRPQFKFWIDSETGVQLKNEKSDAAGRVLSHRYLTSITEGPNLVTPEDFNMGKLGKVKINPLFPQNSQYSSLEQAQGHLPFVPLVATTLPTGFHLGGVWVFPGNNNQMQFVLLRFTDDVTSFSLYEHIVPGAAKPAPIPAFLRHVEHWRILTAHDEIEVTYTGMLTPAQVHDIYYSLP